jgi:hypothetical protein
MEDRVLRRFEALAPTARREALRAAIAAKDGGLEAWLAARRS